jgi:chemotaxis protein methyltransferase CheR
VVIWLLENDMNAIPLQHSITDEQFERISVLVKDACGINLHTGKKELVKARLGKRLRALGLTSYNEYINYVRKDVSGDEATAMLDALSTNVTHFFREPRHFDYLSGTFLPRLAARRGPDAKRVRIWSAGCSSGEEPYSVAVTVLEAFRDLAGWDVKILATDLSTKVLKSATAGRYSPEHLAGVPQAALAKYFTFQGRGADKIYTVNDVLRGMVTFARLNLVDRWPMKGPFDAIFCRNVMIYFDKSTQVDLLERFTNLLARGGILLVGHSESLAGVSHKLEYVEPTIYAKR